MLPSSWLSALLCTSFQARNFPEQDTVSGLNKSSQIPFIFKLFQVLFKKWQIQEIHLHICQWAKGKSVICHLCSQSFGLFMVKYAILWTCLLKYQKYVVKTTGLACETTIHDQIRQIRCVREEKTKYARQKYSKTRVANNCPWSGISEHVSHMFWHNICIFRSRVHMCKWQLNRSISVQQKKQLEEIQTGIILDLTDKLLASGLQLNRNNVEICAKSIR